MQPWPTADEMRAIFEKVKNWGRWGPEDESGALNLITEAKRREAAACVRVGRTVSCARELPVEPAPDNPHPAMHMMVNAGDDCVLPGVGLETVTDFVGVAFHGMATTHIDALCHVFVDGQMYNGFACEEVKSTGARRNSILCAEDGIASRGVLLDIPLLLDLPWLESGHAIEVADLEAAESAAGLQVGEGDILLVYTGRDVRRAKHGPWSPLEDGMPGLHPECLTWLHDRGIAVLGSDCISDTIPGQPPAGWPMPIHQCTLVAMGVHLLDNLKLDDLAAACAENRQWDFLFQVSPLRIARGTGSPVNPVALL